MLIIVIVSEITYIDISSLLMMHNDRKLKKCAILLILLKSAVIKCIFLLVLTYI